MVEWKREGVAGPYVTGGGGASHVSGMGVGTNLRNSARRVV
jgi:hypothetical protein